MNEKKKKAANVATQYLLDRSKRKRTWTISR